MPLEPVAGHGSPQFGPEHFEVRAIDLDPSAGGLHQGARQHERRNTDAAHMAATDQMPDPNKALAPRGTSTHGPRPLANKPIKQICRELRVSRKTVRKVVRSGATEFTYERSVQPQPKIGPWRDELDRMLAENARKPKRDRLTAIRKDGGYNAGEEKVATGEMSEDELVLKALAGVKNFSLSDVSTHGTDMRFSQRRLVPPNL